MSKKDKVEKGYRELPIGGVLLVPGSADDYSTGGWRKLRPILDKDKCTNCKICWVMCPDSAVIVEDGEMIGFDLEHCKGCGICAVECPDKLSAITMVEEEEEEENK
ncbi:MAG: 4Fe-4S binding protein [Thermodesulfobacteriota bacterium]